MIQTLDHAIKITIVGWRENYPPGIIECSLSDRFGKDWRLAVKQYDATTTDLWPESEYPLPGALSCIILARDKDQNGRETVEIELDIPLQNLTEDGVDRFGVFADQLT